MASLVLSGDTSGSITVAAPAVAGSNTQTLAAVTGTLAPVVSGTALTTTGVTNVEFTGIPSWVKKITVMFSGVSSSGTSGFNIQIGSGSAETSGYSGSYVNLSTNTMSSTTYAGSGFQLNANTAAYTWQGSITLTLVSGNIWVANGALGGSSAYGALTMGSKTTSGTIDRVRVITVNTTDTFDVNGGINILYE
jgi:hypothetical protein